MSQITRIRTDLNPRVPTYMRSTQCRYLHPSVLGQIPNGLSICCKWGNRFENAYTVDGKWFLTWDDKPMDEPDGVQVRKGLYDA